eukprot:6181137-Pleurochrysis_carterae.AAC.1
MSTYRAVQLMKPSPRAAVFRLARKVSHFVLAPHAHLRSAPRSAPQALNHLRAHGRHSPSATNPEPPT